MLRYAVRTGLTLEIEQEDFLAEWMIYGTVLATKYTRMVTVGGHLWKNAQASLFVGDRLATPESSRPLAWRTAAMDRCSWMQLLSRTADGTWYRQDQNMELVRGFSVWAWYCSFFYRCPHIMFLWAGDSGIEFSVWTHDVCIVLRTMYQQLTVPLSEDMQLGLLH